ncbi:MAG: low molecular weight phosphotyrosine protein phosphatase [Ignavibacteriaceae bacterium]
MNKKRILFVCMGNICRSPAAEAIMNKRISDNNLSDVIEVDSAGTIDYHSGEGADSRMKKIATKKDYNIDSIARQFNPQNDFKRFDYIVTMDDENYDDILSLDVNNIYSNKIFRMVDFCTTHKAKEIPDPYYSGSSGFEKVIELLEDATNGLLNKVLDDIKQPDQKEN